MKKRYKMTNKARKYEKMNWKRMLFTDRERSFRMKLERKIKSHFKKSKLIELKGMDLRGYSLDISHLKIETLYATDVIASDDIWNHAQEAKNGIHNSDQKSLTTICNGAQIATQSITNYNQDAPKIFD